MVKSPSSKQQEMRLDVESLADIGLEDAYNLYPVNTLPNTLTHPEHLAVIATLFGLKPRSIAQCRVLEIGCGDGGNLIPMAACLPKAQFFGVDLSEVQIKRGQARIKKLQLKNIKLEQKNVLKVGGRIRKFDFILCHDVYSRVGPEEQQRILQIGKDYLAKEGVMCISYDANPGASRMLQRRDMVRFHAQRFAGLEDRIQQSRALLSYLLKFKSGQVDDNGAEKLQPEQLSDVDIVHGYLEPYRDACMVHEFVARAQKHGLRYLVESDISGILLNTLPAELSDTLVRISDDPVQLEQYLDFIRNPSCRMTLLCHDAITPVETIDTAAIQQFTVAANLQCISAQADGASVYRSEDGLEITSRDPVTSKVFDLLSDCWPKACAFTELMALCGSDKYESSMVMDVLQAYAMGVLRLGMNNPVLANKVSDKPLSSLLSRVYANEKNHVVNMFHQVVELDEPMRQLLILCNGKRTLGELCQEMLSLIRQNALQLQFEGEKVDDEKMLASQLEQMVPAMLQQLVRRALIVR